MTTWTKEVVDLTVAGDSLRIDNVIIDDTYLYHISDASKDLVQLLDGAMTVRGQIINHGTLTTDNIITGTLTATSTVNAFGGVNLQDSDKIIIGTGNDTEIFHDGSDTLINHPGTGTIKIGTSEAGEGVQIGHAGDTTEILGNLKSNGTTFTIGTGGQILTGAGDALTVTTSSDSTGYFISNAPHSSVHRLTCGVNYDSWIQFMEAVSAKWAIGNRNSDDSFIWAAGLSLGSNVKMALSTAGDLNTYGDIQVSGNNIKSSTTSTVITLNGDDAEFADDVKLASDSSVLNFGTDSEVKVEHEHNVGLSLTGSSATTHANSVKNVFKVKHELASATPVAGVGTAIQYFVPAMQSSSVVSQHGMDLTCVSTDIDDNKNAFDFVVNLVDEAVAGAAAEKFRVNAKGDAKVVRWFACNGATPQAPKTYTAASQSARNADTASTAGDLQDVVQTLIADLKLVGVIS